MSDKKTSPSRGLKPHHAKPYRKRHVGLFVVSAISIIGLISLMAINSLSNQKLVKDARDLINSAFTSSQESGLASSSEISSNYGFSVKYDSRLLYASALEASTGRLYSGQELSSPLNYSSIKISNVGTTPTASEGGGSLSIEYHYSEPTGSSADLKKLEARYVGANNANFKQTESKDITLAGQAFFKSDWATKPTDLLGSPVVVRLTSYTSVINGAPFTVVINYGVNSSDSELRALDAIVESLQITDPNTPISLEPKVVERASSVSLIDRLMLTSQASAASISTPSSSELTSMLYGPSVVKVYNAYCMDVILAGQLFVQDACSASTGSGFFIGDSGNIATNGHVVVNNPLDIAISYAFDKISKGDPSYLNSLADAASLTNADIAGASTQKEQIKIIVDKLYTIPGSAISATNRVDNILVGLGENQPDMNKLLSATNSRQTYPKQDSIKKADVIAYNYRAIDGANTGAFTASDVAIIKIDGSGYPSTRLGSISSLTQGSGLSIIGYPGAASTNPLVESNESRTTLTSGKVSSIKSAAGSSSQLIETDATIGHGNSGGPAFNDSGEVVGIATYTIDGSGEGNGVFNYVRDIADLSSLAADNKVDLSTISQTQTLWEEGVASFYKAKYSSAVAQFSEVKKLYPQHPKVGQLSELASQKIAAGEEAKSVVTAPTLIASVSLVIILATSLALMIRHHKKHLQHKLALQPQAPTNPVDPTGPIPPSI